MRYKKNVCSGWAGEKQKDPYCLSPFEFGASLIAYAVQCPCFNFRLSFDLFPALGLAKGLHTMAARYCDFVVLTLLYNSSLLPGEGKDNFEVAQVIEKILKKK